MRVSASATAITYKVAMSTEKSAGVTLTASKTPRRLGPKRDRDRGWVPPWPASGAHAISLFDRSPKYWPFHRKPTDLTALGLAVRKTSDSRTPGNEGR